MFDNTKVQTTPFEAVYGQTPPVHVPYLGGLSKVDTVDRTLGSKEQAIQMLKFHLNRFQNRMKQQADKRRSDRILKLKLCQGSPPLSQVMELPSCNKEGLMEPEPIALLDRKMEQSFLSHGENVWHVYIDAKFKDIGTALMILWVERSVGHSNHANVVKEENKMQFGASNSKFKNNGGNTGASTKPLLALPNTTKNWSSRPNTNTPRKQLSQKEYEEKRSKNLCIFVDKIVPVIKVKGQLIYIDFIKMLKWSHFLPNTQGSEIVCEWSGIAYLDRLRLHQPFFIATWHPPIQKDAIEAMVKELLESRVIKLSQSPFSSSIVMVKKKDNTWRMCADYWQLNKSTIKDKFPIPIIDELIDELHGHVQHLTTILSTMRQNKLFAKKTKCVFGTSQVEYLGHVISAQRVATDPSKIIAMKNWPTLTNIKQLRGFLGLTGYYRKSVKNFANVIGLDSFVEERTSSGQEAQKSFVGLYIY
ncbi:hypothetical protein Tco_0576098 [Tanacetum coccineum]